MKTKARFYTLAILLLLPVAVAAQEVFDYTYFDMGYLNNNMDTTMTAIDDRGTTDINVDAGDGAGIRASLAVHPNVHVFAGYTRSNLDVNATHTMPYPTLDAMRAAFFTTEAAENWDTMCDLNTDGAINFLDLAMLKEAGDGAIRETSRAAVGGDIKDWKVGVGYNRLIAPRIGGFAQVFWNARNLDVGTAAFMGENRDFGVKDNGVGATVGLRGKITDRFDLNGHVTYTPVGDIDMLAATTDDMLRNDTLIGIGGEFAVTDTFSILAEVEGDGDANAWLIAARYEIGR